MKAIILAAVEESRLGTINQNIITWKFKIMTS